MDNKFAQQLKKGVLDMVVLRLVEEKSTYGYEIIQQLEQRGEGFFNLKEGTLYPVLYRLEDSGLIESFWQKWGRPDSSEEILYHHGKRQ